MAYYDHCFQGRVFHNGVQTDMPYNGSPRDRMLEDCEAITSRIDSSFDLLRSRKTSLSRAGGQSSPPREHQASQPIDEDFAFIEVRDFAHGEQSRFYLAEELCHSHETDALALGDAWLCAHKEHSQWVRQFSQEVERCKEATHTLIIESRSNFATNNHYSAKSKHVDAEQAWPELNLENDWLSRQYEKLRLEQRAERICRHQFGCASPHNDSRAPRRLANTITSESRWGKTTALFDAINALARKIEYGSLGEPNAMDSPQKHGRNSLTVDYQLLERQATRYEMWSHSERRTAAFIPNVTARGITSYFSAAPGPRQKDDITPGATTATALLSQLKPARSCSGVMFGEQPKAQHRVTEDDVVLGRYRHHITVSSHDLAQRLYKDFCDSRNFFYNGRFGEMLGDHPLIHIRPEIEALVVDRVLSESGCMDLARLRGRVSDIEILRRRFTSVDRRWPAAVRSIESRTGCQTPTTSTPSAAGFESSMEFPKLEKFSSGSCSQSGLTKMVGESRKASVVREAEVRLVTDESAEHAIDSDSDTTDGEGEDAARIQAKRVQPQLVNEVQSIPA